MEDSTNNRGPVETLSPPRITDFFNSSKIRTRGKNKSTKRNELSVSTVLENDSSSDSAKENKHVTLSKNSHATTDFFHMDNAMTNLDMHEEQHTTSVPQVKESYAPESSSTPDVDPDSCSCDTQTDVTQDNKEAASKASNQAPPLIDGAQPAEAKAKEKNRSEATLALPDKTLSESPSLPRPKIRRGAKSRSKADAVVVVDAEPVKPKPGRRKKKEPEPVQKNVITDYFPVRRSGRQTSSSIEKEKNHQLEQQVLSKCEDGLQITESENKGRGVVATKEFSKGDFVVEYAGDLIDLVTAKQREQEYSSNPAIGCYMYFFSLGAKHYCVDATAESGRLGRLINHSREGNCCTRAIMVRGRPHLILVASRDIKHGEELSYDYGDRSKAALEAHPWLKS